MSALGGCFLLSCAAVQRPAGGTPLRGIESLVTAEAGTQRIAASTAANGQLLLAGTSDAYAVSAKGAQLWRQAAVGAVAAAGTDGTDTNNSTITAVAMTDTTAMVAVQWQASNAAGEVAAVQLYRAKDGAADRRIGIPSTGSVRFHDIVRFSDGFVIAGEFTDTMRIGAFMLSSAGGTDGFYARIKGDGTVLWAHRFGGNENDAATRIDAASDRGFVLAGTFTRQADWRGQTLTAINEQSPVASGVIALLDATGTLQRSDVFFSPRPIAIADVAINSQGDIGLALTARQQVQWSHQLANIDGAADAVLAWYRADLTLTNVTRLGDNDYDGASALAALPCNQWLVTGWCSGACTIANTKVTATDGTAAFAATINAIHQPVTALAITSASHEWAGPIQTDATGWWLLLQGGADLAVNGKPVGSAASLLRFAYDR